MENKTNLRPAKSMTDVFRLVFFVFLAVYAAHAFFVVTSNRHLYGDASWYLVRMLSEGDVTRFYTDFTSQFYYSRFLAFSLTQWPTVFAIRLGINDLAILSYIYGLTFFSWKFISLIACYRLLPEEAKSFVLLPILGLIAGTINSEIYLVTETHIATAFYWPLLISIIWLPTSLSRTRVGCLVLMVVVSTFLFESMAFLLLLPLALLVSRAIRHDKASGASVRVWVLCTALAAGIAVNWAAILFPRDPVNKASFVGGLYLNLHDAMQGMGNVHIGPAISITFLVLATIVMVLEPGSSVRRISAWAGAALLATLPVLHFWRFHDSLVFWNSITDRGFSGLLMQFGLAVLLISANLISQLRNRLLSTEIGILVVGLIFGQLSWQALITKSWIEATAAIKHVLATQEGPRFCPLINNEYANSLGIRLDHILCNWWITPLSIVLSPSGQVRSLLISSESFQPFDPLRVDSLPRMKSSSVNYAGYIQTLATATTIAPGSTLDFTINGLGWLHTTSGFSNPEPWGTWTVGPMATMSLCIRTDTSFKNKVRMRYKVGAFVPEARPSLLVTISIDNKEISTWSFSKNEGISERLLDLPLDSFQNNCAKLVFSMSDVASPASLGMSGDPRNLGVSFIQMKAEQ